MAFSNLIFLSCNEYSTFHLDHEKKNLKDKRHAAIYILQCFMFHKKYEWVSHFLQLLMTLM